MFDRAHVGQDVLGEFTAPAALQSWSRVVIRVDDDTTYTAGTDTGRTLTVAIPYGTQQMAEAMLRRIRGQSYQPYSAGSSVVSPAAELGDAVEVRGVYGGLYKRARNLDRLYTADLAAPGDEEVDHEYPYKSAQARQITRQRRQTKASLRVLADKIALEVTAREEGQRQLSAAITVQADRITQEVSARENGERQLSAAITVQADRISQEVTDRVNATNYLSSQITQQAGQISAKVSKSGGDSRSFGWNLLDSYMAWYSSGVETVRFDASGAKIRGRIEALTGKIGGFDIGQDALSYNGQTWGGTNTWGCYLGVNGIQLGRNFKVDMAGNLEAASGRFTGEVYAGHINYGGDAGYLWGEAISEDSIFGGSGGQISASTIDTSNTVWGINNSLGNADYAYDVTCGYQHFDSMIGDYLSARSISLGGNALGKIELHVQTNNGLRYLRLVTWEDY